MSRTKANRLTPPEGGLRERLERAIAFVNDPSADPWQLGFDLAGPIYDPEPPVDPGGSLTAVQDQSYRRARAAWRASGPRLICSIPPGRVTRRMGSNVRQELAAGFTALVQSFQGTTASRNLSWLRKAIDERRLRWQFYPRTGSDEAPGAYNIVPTMRAFRDVPLALLVLAVLEGYGPLIIRCEECSRFALGQRRRPLRFCGRPCAYRWHNANRKERFTAYKARQKKRRGSSSVSRSPPTGIRHQ